MDDMKRDAQAKTKRESQVSSLVDFKLASASDAQQSLENIREVFSRDNFATQACVCRIVEAAEGHAVCEFDIGDVHLNARGVPMGGAIFTLADFALAVASNVGKPPTASLSASIEFLAVAKGNKLIASCDVLKDGRQIGFYEICVSDELGTLVARMHANCYRSQ